jgi:hypothetical protein
MFHHDLADGHWQKLSLSEQLGNIGSEVDRAARWQGKDEKIFWAAAERALELFDLSLDDWRWRGARSREIIRAREFFTDGILGGAEYGTKLADLESYFLPFALAARHDR